MKMILGSILFAMLFLDSGAQMVLSLDSDSAYINRLKTTVTSGKSDSIRSEAAFLLSQCFTRSKDSLKANHYLNIGKSLAGKNKFLQAASLYYEAFSKIGRQDNKILEPSLRRSDSLLSQFTTPHAYKIRSGIWNFIGVIEQLKGSEKKALDAYINYSLPLAKKSNDYFTIASADKFVGIIFLNSEERDKAANYLSEALSFFEQSSDEENPGKLEAIVETSIILAENDLFRKRTEAARMNLEKAKKLLEPYPQSNIYLFYYFPEGTYYNETGQYDKALISFDKGLAMVRSHGGSYYGNRIKYAKFKTLSKLKRYSEAISTMLSLVNSPIILPTDRKIYYKELSEVYAVTGNVKDAYKWSQKYIAFSDSLYETKYKADLVELEKKYVTVEKENRINILEAEKRKNSYEIKTARLSSLLWAIGCVLFLVAACFLFHFLRNNKRMAKQKDVNHKQQLFQIEQQQQIALGEAMMQGEELERQRLARDLHDGLGGMLAGIKIKMSHGANGGSAGLHENSDVIKQLDCSISELRRIARNMMPETLIRFGLDTSLNDLCVALSNAKTKVNYESYGVSNEIDKTKQIVIYRIIQECLSNALRHADATVIDLQCSQNGRMFFITIEDNGVGFDKESGTKGIGLLNIKNRVMYLNGRFDIDSRPGVGTTINIELDVANKTGIGQHGL